MRSSIPSWFHGNYETSNTNSVFSTLHSVEKWEIYSHWKIFCQITYLAQCEKTRNSLSTNIFREINYSVTSVVKTLLSRNFCQKSVRENFRDFHTVLCGNFRIFLPFKIYVKSIFRIVKVQKWPLLPILKLSLLIYLDAFLQFVRAEICPKTKFIFIV